MTTKDMIDRNPMVNFTEVNTGITMRAFFKYLADRSLMATGLYEMNIPAAETDLLMVCDTYQTRIKEDTGWTRYWTETGISYVHADFDKVYQLEQDLIAAWWMIETHCREHALKNAATC